MIFNIKKIEKMQLLITTHHIKAEFANINIILEK